MYNPTFKTKAKLWLYDGPAAWHFLTINKTLSKKIKAEAGPRKGFGSVRVQATIGSTAWRSSIFPDKSGTYLLPVKASIRQKESLSIGRAVQLVIELI